MTDLFAPYQLGPAELANRLVMAPLTRNRAGAGEAPTALAAEYYAQRATAGLIITEGTQPSAVGQGYPHTPGLHTDEQVAGWRLVADAVHAAGGRIVAQLMHSGRIGHVAITGLQPVAPSAVAAAGEVYTEQGMQAFDDAARARRPTSCPASSRSSSTRRGAPSTAGLDGVELHAANGYLLQQFLADSTNTRTDGYGGSPENRARFVVEVATAVAAAIGGDRVGIRVSPAGTLQRHRRDRGRADLRRVARGARPARSALPARRWRARRRATTSSCASSGTGLHLQHRLHRAVATWRPRRRRSTAARPTCSASVAPSWPTPTWSSGSGPVPSSTSPTPTPSTPAAPRATPTTRRWPPEPSAPIGAPGPCDPGAGRASATT